MRLTRRSWLLLVIACLAMVGCREEQGGVSVDDLSFTGLDAVSESQLKSILATAESPNLPWGTKQ